MNITVNEVKNILNMLPIGYYLGRKIDVEFFEDDSAYFMPDSDKIHIGYYLISKPLAPLSAKDIDVESVIRGILYHEISHVILTPANLKACIESRYADVINIVEDERIETILKSFYLNVNFKKNIVIINNFTGQAPKTPDEAFYQLVRFHIGDKKWLNRLSNLISKYKDINASTPYYKYHDYARDIANFYDEFVNAVKDNLENNSDSSSKDSSSSSSGSNGSPKSASASDNTSDSSESRTMVGISSAGAADAGSTSSEDISKTVAEAENEMSDELAEQIADMVKDLEVSAELTDEDIKTTVENAISSVINKFYDASLIANVQRVVDRKLKQKSKNGSAINSYSGRFNPRAVATRDDYKWWAQQNRAGHIRQYSKVHFNLFIDNSGSFSDNDTMMNSFIKALTFVNDPNFSFDVITINTEIKEWDGHDHLFRSNGGNRLRHNIGPVVKKHQKPNCNNFNIVLFDGDAHSDDHKQYLPEMNTKKDPFKYFDLSNAIIISDNDNRGYISKSVHTARVIYTNNYCQKFIGIILDMLERMM